MLSARALTNKHNVLCSSMASQFAYRPADILHLLYRVTVLNGRQVADGIPHSHGAQRRAHLHTNGMREWIVAVGVPGSKGMWCVRLRAASMLNACAVQQFC